MKKHAFARMMTAPAAVCAALMAAACSNMLSSFTNEAGVEKTGNDSVTTAGVEITPPTDNPNITTGLVVIKQTQPSLNQIWFDEQTLDYTVSGIESADDAIELRCFAADKWATVTWSASQVATSQQVQSLDDVDDGTYQPLDEPQTVTLIEGGDQYHVTMFLPYGITQVSATVTADDPQYHTTYTITLKKPLVCADGTANGNMAQITSLTLTPHLMDQDDMPEGYEPEIEIYNPMGGTDGFASTKSVYQGQDDWYWINEDVGTITVDITLSDGVELVGMSYDEQTLGHGITMVTERSQYVIDSVGGEKSLVITTKDIAGIERQYDITIKKPESSDTSLRRLDFDITGYGTTQITGVRNAEPTSGTLFSLLQEEEVGFLDHADYYKDTPIELSANYRADLDQFVYHIVPFHKRASVQYATTDNPGATAASIADSAWKSVDKTLLETSSGKGQYYGYDIPIRYDTTSLTTGADAEWLDRTVWLKVIAEDKTARYFTLRAKKPARGNTTLEGLMVYTYDTREKAEKQTEETQRLYRVPQGNDFSQSVILSDENKKFGDTTGQYSYLDGISFYLITANKNAVIRYSLNDETERHEVDTTEISQAGLTTRAFAIGPSRTAQISHDDQELGGGTTRVHIYVGNTDQPTLTYAVTKPEDGDTELYYIDCYDHKYYAGTTEFDTFLENGILSTLTQGVTDLQLKVVMKSKKGSVAVSDFAQTESINNLDFKTNIATSCVQDTTWKTDWTITIGSGADPIPQGTSSIKLTTSSTAEEPGDPIERTLSMHKETAGEARLKNLTVTVAGTPITLTKCTARILTPIDTDAEGFDKNVCRIVQKGDSDVQNVTNTIDYVILDDDQIPENSAGSVTISATTYDPGTGIYVTKWNPWDTQTANSESFGSADEPIATGAYSFSPLGVDEAKKTVGEDKTDWFIYSIVTVSADGTTSLKYDVKMRYKLNAPYVGPDPSDPQAPQDP